MGKGLHFKLKDALKYIERYVSEPNEQGCTLWLGPKRGGRPGNRYPAAWFSQKCYSAHRLQWELVRGPIPDGMLVCHHCDEPLCMNIEHHFLGTHKDNSEDMVRKNRQSRMRGLDRWNTKLTDQQVTEVRMRVLAGEEQKKLAEEFGVSRSLICQIAKQKVRKELV